MRPTKTPVTVRLNAELLAEVRASAARDNRSLTNYIETALRQCVGADSSGPRRPRAAPPRAAANRAVGGAAVKQP